MNKLVSLIIIFVDKLISKILYTPKRCTRRVILGDSKKTNQLCLFAHYDQRYMVDPYVFYHLKELASLGFSIYFITASKTIREKDLKKLKQICSKIIFKKDKGRDFGSYYTGFFHIKNISDYKRILFVNDSMYGPLSSLQKIFDKMSNSGLDIWGITDSYDKTYHIQSYFVVFEKQALQSKFFQYFWKQFYFTEVKKVIIARGEIALSVIAKRLQLKLGAYCPFYEVLMKTILTSCNETSIDNHKNKNTIINAYNYYNYYNNYSNDSASYFSSLSLGKCNLTHYSWHVLLKDFNCPYLKIELLKINPTSIKNISFVWDYIEDENIKNLIVNHLKNEGNKKLLNDNNAT